MKSYSELMRMRPEAFQRYLGVAPEHYQEMLDYDEQPFRQYRGRSGIIEARIPFIQLRPGEYLVSLGNLPKRQDLHEFYEYRHMAYRIVVFPNGFPEPAVFYAQVEWTHGAMS